MRQTFGKSDVCCVFLNASEESVPECSPGAGSDLADRHLIRLILM